MVKPNTRVKSMKEPSDSKILIMSLGHPDLSKGGAEIAAHNLYKE